MRFSEQGPPIPQELLAARDAGDAAFLCGAGVSVAAGLPSFEKLTIQVLEDLGAEFTTELERKISNYEYDKIFSNLVDCYGRTMVDKSVASFLQTNSSSFTGNHRSILTLSKDNAGQPQVITTNYDHLFEQAAAEDQELLKHYQSGSFPSLTGESNINGLIYLHGRLNASDQIQNFILSESDFGKAYLTVGSARTMLMEVIHSKHLILLGYSGNDPVVQYLFKGLQASPNKSEYNIYAFSGDNSPEAKALWEQRGVTPLIYDSSGGHGVLWESLEQWSEMVQKPTKWLKKMRQLYVRNPLELSPHQRGQVTTMLKNRHEARAFAAHDPSTTSSWILVFDAFLRKKLNIQTDDDSCDEKTTDFEDFLSAHTSDLDFEHQSVSLAAYRESQVVTLPPRLQSIRSWICRHCDDPLILWWIAGYRRVGSELLYDLELEYERRKRDLDDGAYKALSLICDHFRTPPMIRHNFDWYGFEAQLRNHGWRKETLREFRRVTRPKLSIERNYYSESLNKLITGKLSAKDLIPSELINIKVVFPAIDASKIDAPPEYLYKILRILTEHLDLATSYLTSIGIPPFHGDTLHQLEKPDFYDSEHQLQYLHSTAKLFDRLVEHDAEKAKIILSLWDASDKHLQGQLTLYALHKGQSLGVDYSFEKLHSLSDAIFWNCYYKRERLFSLKAIWNDLTESRRHLLEQRILKGDHSEYDSEFEDYTTKHHRSQIAVTLGYLLQNECNLSLEAQANYSELIKTIEHWRDEWCQLSDEELERGARCIITDENPSELLEIPISETINTAIELSGRDQEDWTTDKNPFAGLVKLNPRRPYLALSRSTHPEEIQLRFWKQFIGYFPEKTSLRFRAIVIERVVQLPSQILSPLAKTFTDWIQKQIKEFYDSDKTKTLSTWSRVLNRLAILPADAFESGMGRAFVGGKELNRSPQSYGYAINSSASKLIEITLSLGQYELEEKERRIPKIIQDSLPTLLDLPGEGQSAVVCILGRYSNQLYRLDSNWYTQYISPLMKEASPTQEAFFNGFVHYGYVPDSDFMKICHADLINFLQENKTLAWDDHEIDNLITKITFSAITPITYSRVILFSEVRSCLKSLGKVYASHAINTVRKVLKREDASWDLVGKPFFKSIWPKESEFQTEESSRQIFYLLTSSENFAERVRDLSELLRPIKHCDGLIYGLEDKDSSSSLWRKYPREILLILDRILPHKGNHQPYNLISFIEKVVQQHPELRHSMEYKSLMDRC